MELIIGELVDVRPDCHTYKELGMVAGIVTDKVDKWNYVLEMYDANYNKVCPVYGMNTIDLIEPDRGYTIWN